MRALRYAITGLVVLATVSVRAAAWPWPAAGGQARHSSGVVLLGPIDYDAIRNAQSFEGPLRRAWSDSFTLAQLEPDLFGYPWADRTAGELVVSVAEARGVEIVEPMGAVGATGSVAEARRAIHDRSAAAGGHRSDPLCPALDPGTAVGHGRRDRHGARRRPGRRSHLQRGSGLRARPRDHRDGPPK